MPLTRYSVTVVVTSHDPVNIVRESLTAALACLPATIVRITLSPKR